MAKKSRITLDIPDPEGFDDESSYGIPVSSEAVSSTIDLLQCFIAQYRHDVDVGCHGRGRLGCSS
jgi:hypothetical protein